MNEPPIREPFEPPSVKDWALIIHADSAGDRIDIYWVDINAGREGLRLAQEVKAWRRRDDLLTIANRLRIEVPAADIEDRLRARGVPEQFVRAMTEPEPPPDAATAPAEPPRTPAEPRESSNRLTARRDYLRGRVRAILEHSETAKMGLARVWPEGVPGLKHEGHTWEQLDEILGAVEFIETNHSVPFYPAFIDPDIEQSKLEHPSNVWAYPRATKSTTDDKQNIRTAMLSHKRSMLIRRWIMGAKDIDQTIDHTALSHALYEFACLDETEWPDDDLTTMLDGSLRALGYLNGCQDLGKFDPNHAPLLMSAAFAITAGTAYLLFDDDGKPIVRTNVRKP